MKFLRAAASQVIGLFVSDWVQSGVIVVILAVGWLAVSRVGPVAVVVIVLLLAAQLVWFARAEARRTRTRAHA
jgi:hypothetical protein